MFIKNSYNMRFGQAMLPELQQKTITKNNHTVSNPANTLPSGAVRVKDLYINDVHGMLYGFRKFKSVRDDFVSQTAKEKDVVSNVFISGDSSVGAFRPKNKLIVALQNMIKPDAVTGGNHEFDDKGALGYSELLDEAKYPTLALNMEVKPDTPLDDDIKAGRLLKSKIIEKNGQKFGLIGLVPSDLFNRVNQVCKDNSQNVTILDKEATFDAVQKEVDAMEKMGVNKITVISHMGIDADKEMAQKVVGVDVIHGAHSHDLLKGIVPNENMFISKRNEPVLITQAAKNGHWYGISDIVYDVNGKIIQAENKVESLDDKRDSLLALTLENMMLGKPNVIGELIHDVKSQPETEFSENPMSSFLCDAYKKLTNADIVLNNAGTMRHTLKKGPVTDRMIIDMMAFYNDISTYRLSEKDVIDAINGGLEATITSHRTGALQVAGIQYVIGKNNRVKEAYILKDDGTKEKIDAQNPRIDKFYSVAYNTFLSSGTDGLEVLHCPEKKIKTFDQNETDLLIEYFKSFNGKPLSIDRDGRITREV